jgi:hypothetical protein
MLHAFGGRPLITNRDDLQIFFIKPKEATAEDYYP